MAIEGPLRELGIHDVFQLLDLSRKTGVLRVTSDLRHNAGTVHFEAGAMVAPRSAATRIRSGALLLRTGKVDEADLERAPRHADAPGTRGGWARSWCAAGLISQRELDRQVRHQIEEVVFELMSWHEGYFSFEEGKHGSGPPRHPCGSATEALLMEGARRTDEWSRIEKKIPHLGVVPKLAPVVDTALLWTCCRRNGKS